MDAASARTAQAVPELPSGEVGCSSVERPPSWQAEGEEESGLMKHNVSVLPLLVLLCFGPAQRLMAQKADPEVTSGAIQARNGRYWNRLSENEKLAYLMGFQEATGIVALSTAGSYERFKQVTNQYLGRSTFGEVVDGLNAFYAEPANRPIAVVRAMVWYQDKANGRSAAELQEELEKMRASVKDN